VRTKEQIIEDIKMVAGVLDKMIDGANKSKIIVKELLDQKSISLPQINENLAKAVQFILNPNQVDTKKFPFTLAKKSSLFEGDLCESLLINRENQYLLQEWLPKDTKKLTLLFRATKDGFSASSFHAKCDNKGATLTVIKSGSNVFGG
jgi:hypothetical protein